MGRSPSSIYFATTLKVRLVRSHVLSLLLLVRWPRLSALRLLGSSPLSTCLPVVKCSLRSVLRCARNITFFSCSFCCTMSLCAVPLLFSPCSVEGACWGLLISFVVVCTSVVDMLRYAVHCLSFLVCRLIVLVPDALSQQPPPVCVDSHNHNHHDHDHPPLDGWLSPPA